MPAGHSRTENLPQRFGEFLLFDKIGQGGMAEIFLAKSLGPLGQQRLTVIKRVLPLLSADPQFADMLIAEAKLCASLSHKNVVQVTDLGRVEDQLYIAMEYVEGFDLNDLLTRCTRAKVPLPAEFVFLILEETLRALDYAHRASDSRGRPLQIIHRDVSPTNVLISCEGEVKLCDFGIARAVAFDATLPEGALKGKFAYMSPEQARGEAVDQRSDLFATGILAWEMIAGHRLYRGNANEVLRQARAGDVPPLPDRGLPRYQRVAEMIQRALAVDPAERFQTANDMLEAVDDYVREAGLFASQIRFSRFLRDNFGDELQRQRRERERASLSPGAGASSASSPAPRIELSRPRLQVVSGSPPPPEPGEGPEPPPAEASPPPPSIGLRQARSLAPPSLDEVTEPVAAPSWASARFSEDPPVVIARRPRRAGGAGAWVWIAISLGMLLVVAAVGYAVLS